MADMARALRRQRRAAKKAGYARLFTLVEGSARCAIASPGKEILKRCIRAYPSIGKRRDGTLLKGFRAWVRNQHVQHHQFGLVLETKGTDLGFAMAQCCLPFLLAASAVAPGEPTERAFFAWLRKKKARSAFFKSADELVNF
eukprot:gene28369-31497_t